MGGWGGEIQSSTPFLGFFENIENAGIVPYININKSEII
jgi:hypothetical protein